MSNSIKNRYDFVFLFDVKDGNPNGDPDQDNLPRVDAENQEGLVTDVCIKRKVRNYVGIKFPNEDKKNTGHAIFIRQGEALNKTIESAKENEIKDKQIFLCDRYWDIRTFGAVLATGDAGAGTVRGPVQFTFSRSEDRIYQAEHTITRCAVATEKEKESQKDREYASTIGRKSTVPYALYRMHGFVSAVDAAKRGFTEDDLNLLWEALLNAFEHDRSAARGEMNPRKLIVFKHDSHLGNARAGELFETIVVKRKPEVELPRAYSDYEISVPKQSSLPKGISLEEKL
jgi:CRISPR-associated protein Csd2